MRRRARRANDARRFKIELVEIPRKGDGPCVVIRRLQWGVEMERGMGVGIDSHIKKGAKWSSRASEDFAADKIEIGLQWSVNPRGIDHMSRIRWFRRDA